MTTTERLPPHNTDAERAVLSIVLHNNRAMSEVVANLRPEDFYAWSNQEIFLLCVEFYQRGKAIDHVVLSDALDARRKMAEIGYAYLVDLWEAAPRPESIVVYAEIVRGKSILRQLIQAANEIGRDCQDSVDEPSVLAEQAERKIFAISQRGILQKVDSMAEAVNEATDRFSERVEAVKSGTPLINGVATGWPDLDRRTCGLRNGELIILGSRPGVGKTAMAVNLAYNVGVRSGLPVFFASLEQAKAELAERSICLHAHLDALRVRGGCVGRDEVEKWMQARGVLAGTGIQFDEHPYQTMLRIGSTARRLKVSHDIRLVIVDYLQLVSTENRREPRHEQVAAVSRQLKLLARELRVPILALAQVNRAPMDRGDRRPRLSDLRESGAIEADADVVLLLHTQDADDEGNRREEVLEVIIAKQRHGPTGMERLVFCKGTGRIENYCHQRPFAGSVNGTH